MSSVFSADSGFERPSGPRVRTAFWLVWLADLVATLCFFLVPYARELNPVTVHLYGLFGLSGVVLAAATYAVAVVGIGYVLTGPLDDLFVGVTVTAYALFVTNNVLVLVFRDPLLGLVPT